jgi:hypothetical protein
LLLRHRRDDGIRPVDSIGRLIGREDQETQAHFSPPTLLLLPLGLFRCSSVMADLIRSIGLN